MKPTDDIAPLAELAEREFNRLMGNAHDAVNELTNFWTKLYGPNECALPLREALDTMSDTFYESDGE